MPPQPASLFLRGLLLAILLGISLAAHADSALQLPSDKSPALVADCLQQGIRRLKIPDDYVKRDTAADKTESIRLLNPVSNKTSLQVAIRPQGEGSQLQADQNGIPLTPPWQRLIKRCAE
jgi:hypothetical protein